MTNTEVRCPDMASYLGLFVLTSRSNVASVGSVFNDTRKVKVLSLSETFQVVREPLPFAYLY